MGNISYKITHKDDGTTIVVTAKKDGKTVSAEGSTLKKALSAFFKLVGLATVVTAIAMMLNSCATEHTMQSVVLFRNGGQSDTITFPQKGRVTKDTMTTLGDQWVMKTWEKGGTR